MAVGSSPFSVTAQANAADHGSSGASYSATLLFTITGGTGSGEFAPCFVAPEYGFGLSGSGSLSFASVYVNPTATCPTTLAAGDFVPFVFGAQQSEQVVLTVNASAGPEGGGIMASLYGFSVLDSNGNPLANATVNVVDPDNILPEPRMSALFGIALMLGWALRRQL